MARRPDRNFVAVPFGGGSRRRRGSVPLIMSLKEAFEIAEKMYEQTGGIASPDMLSQILGNSVSSSSFVKKVNALRTYGLIELNGADYCLTEIGGAIAAPRDKHSRATALKEAFLNVDVFAKLFERHKGKLLPADEFLKNIIEQDCKIPKEFLRDWVRDFKIAAEAAELLFPRGDGKVQIMESPIIRHPRTDAVSTDEKAQENGSIEIAPEVKASNMIASGHSSGTAISESGHNTRIQLSGNRQAIFFIPDLLTKKDSQKLKSALKGFEAIIDSMELDEEEGV